jgi:hypothetical protein
VTASVPAACRLDKGAHCLIWNLVEGATMPQMKI